MRTVDDYRTHAEDCRRLAKRARTDEERATINQMVRPGKSWWTPARRCSRSRRRVSKDPTRLLEQPLDDFLHLFARLEAHRLHGAFPEWPPLYPWNCSAAQQLARHDCRILQNHTYEQRLVRRSRWTDRG